jgi:hypothetical protein
MTRIRDLAGLGVAVAGCTAILAAGPVESSAPAADPGTLAGAWPYARAFYIPGAVPSGEAYQPLAIISDGVSIGTTKSGGGTAISLVQVNSTHNPATVRILQPNVNASRVSYDAFAVTGTDTYVMRNTTGAGGIGSESLWRIHRVGGRLALMTADAGAALFQGSVDDLQVAGAMLRWVASAPEDPSRTQLRSIPLDGGAQQVRTLPDTYVLTTYPMLYRGELTDPPHPLLTNSLTGNVTAVESAEESGTSCDPVWCVMQTSDDTGANTVQLCHPDGTALQRLGDGNTSLLTADPALLDRFVALTEQSPAMATMPSPTEQLWLYDIRSRHSVEVTGAASAAFGVGGWLWWSTGDNETLTWHALDLGTLR